MTKNFNETIFVAEQDKACENQFLKQVADYDKKMAPIMRANGFTRINESERTVLFTFGEMTFSRSRWSNGRQTRYPVDEWLGLKKYMRYSLDLIYHVSRHASVMSYRQVCRTVESAYRLNITKDSVLKAVKMAGRLFSERERYRFFQEEEAPNKIKAKRLYLEGDGVMVKTASDGNEYRNTDLAHFLVHTGSQKVGQDRYVLENKHEIIHVNYEQAKEELLDYLYNHFEITDETVLITNSDNGKGYTRRFFQEIKKALGIKHHEHFWDAYHLNEKIKSFLKPYPEPLKELTFKAIQTHKRSLLKTVLDTIESLIEDEEDYARFISFSQKLLRNFKDTKPASLRGLSTRGIGVMESQHRKITYRMKHRGMYWSRQGACAMAKLIVLERIDQLEELFMGCWRREYEQYQDISLSAGYANHRTINNPSGVRTYKSAHKGGRWLTHAK